MADWLYSHRYRSLFRQMHPKKAQWSVVRTRGQWSKKEQNLHINQLLATKFVILTFAHSKHSAATSKVSASGLSMTEILERRTWSNKSTLLRFYKENIIPIHVENFQNSVMGEHNDNDNNNNNNNNPNFSLPNLWHD